MKINGETYSIRRIAGMMDYSILGADTNSKDIIEACEFAKKWQVAGVHANPIWAKLIKEQLDGTLIEVGFPVGFPLGALPSEFKIRDAKEAIKIFDGCPSCIDMVTNIGKLKDKQYDYYRNEIAEVVKIGHSVGIEVKAILEVALLTDQELVKATELAIEAGVDLVKTSTGRGGNPEIRQVKMMSDLCKPKGVGVKFSGYGGYNSTELTLMAIAAGATRLGTSRAPRIVKELEKYRDMEINI